MPLRPDEPRPGLSQEELLKNAPKQEGGQFKIPPVFE
jgi:aspartyl-tRNA(Asn)/glutamyl-tRNA(Gln) amidotransferase subunit C